MTKQQHAKMMKRRRTTVIIAAAVLALILLILIVRGIVSSKKEKAEETTAKVTTTAAETTTEEETTTEVVTAATTRVTDDGVTIGKDGSVVWPLDSSYSANHTYCVGVNRAQNTVTVYKKNSSGSYEPYKAILCSCGREGHETPLGTFTTSDGKEWLYMVDATWGQYARRFNGSIYFHSVCYYTQENKGDLEYEEYNKLGDFASRGCVRMCVADAKWIYENLEWGTKVVVYDADVPGPLGKPEGIKIDVTSPNKGWDPTDPDPANPWNK